MKQLFFKPLHLYTFKLLHLYTFGFYTLILLCLLFPILGFSNTKIVPLKNAVSSSGLVGYWPLDENAPNNFVKDYSGNGNHGTSIQNTNLVSTTTAKYGRAMSFNGTSDYVNVANDTSLDLDTATSEITLAAWIKTSASDAVIIGMRHTVNDPPVIDFQLGYDGVDNANTGRPAFLVRDNAGVGLQHIHGITAINDNSWHHVTATRNSSKTMKIYVDGTEVATGTDTMTSAVTTDDVRIGDESRNGSISNFNGSIDDVRIYNRALSATEIKTLYQMGSTKIQTGASNYGLVGYWPMNEGTGTVVNDMSGNRNTGTTTGNPTWVQGKFGKALSFDGTDDRITIPYHVSLAPTNITMSYWLKEISQPSDLDTLVARKYDGTGVPYLSDLRASGNDFQITFGTYTGQNHFVTSNTKTILNKWYHVVGTFDGANYKIYINGVLDNTLVDSTALYQGTSLELNIGWLNFNGTVSRFLDGLIDDVRIYNRALSATEIQTLYQMGSTKIKTGASNYGLVGYWPMNEGTGTVINDMSGNRNTGTTTGNPTWVQGKFGKALSFDGTNDYVVINGFSNWTPAAFSVAYWIKPNNCVDYNQMLMAGSWGNFVVHTGVGCPMWVGTDIGTRFYESDLPSNTMTLNRWQHFIYTYNGVQGNFYKNGVLLAGPRNQTAPTSWSYFALSDPSSINKIDGLIDDVRIYNRALSATEVRNLYNLGKPRY